MSTDMSGSPFRVQPDQHGLDVVAKTLEAGDLALIPTDTVYGLCALASKPQAIEKLFQIKKRTRSKAIAILVSDLEQAKGLAHFSPVEEHFVKRYWPGSLTIVVTKKPNTPNFLGNSDGTLALRVPDDEFCKNLACQVGPLAVTSANISGEPTSSNPYDSNEKLLDSIAVIVDGGERETVASTVVQIGPKGAVSVLRHGSLSIKFD